MMDEEEAEKLSAELGELSEFGEQNKERIKEIAHILVAYYMGGKTVKDAEKKSVEDDPKNIA